MGYKRITIHHNDRNNKLVTHDRVYKELDELLSQYIGLGKDTHENAFDTKFYIEELVDNFLEYDDMFTKVTIDVRVHNDDDVELKVIHDGNAFDPLSPESTCESIKAAINRLNVSKQEAVGSDRETLRFSIKYKLKNVTKAGSP